MRRLITKYAAEYLIFTVFSAILLGVTAFRSSPLSSAIGGDYDVFRQMASYWMAMDDIYVGIFDNKGPYLFLFNLIGLCLAPGKVGIFILEGLNMGLVLWLLLRIGRLLTSSRRRIALGFGAFLVAIISTVGGGDLVEEWSLPWVLLPTYLCFRYLKSDDDMHPLAYTFVYGICFGVIALMRVNNNAIIVGILLGLAYIYLRKGYYAALCANIGVFLAGAVLAMAPAIIYFWSKGALYDMLYATFIYNVHYREVWGSPSHKTMVLNAMKMMACVFVIPAAAIYDRKRHTRYLPVVLCMAAVTFYVFVGGTDYQHYFMMASPIVFLLAVQCQYERWYLQAVSLTIVLALYYHPMHWTDFKADPFSPDETSARVRQTHPGFEQTLKIIPAEELDDVYVLNPGHDYQALMYHLERQPVGKYFVFQDKIAEVTDEARQDIKDSFAKANPKWIVSTGTLQGSVLEEYAGNYALTDSATFIIYRRIAP